MELQAELDLVKQQYGSRTDLMNSLSLLESYRSGATEENLKKSRMAGGTEEEEEAKEEEEEAKEEEEEAKEEEEEASDLDVGNDEVPEVFDSTLVEDAAVPESGGDILVSHLEVHSVVDMETDEMLELNLETDWAHASEEDLAQHIFNLGPDVYNHITVRTLKSLPQLKKLSPKLKTISHRNDKHRTVLAELGKLVDKAKGKAGQN